MMKTYAPDFLIESSYNDLVKLIIDYRQYVRDTGRFEFLPLTVLFNFLQTLSSTDSKEIENTVHPASVREAKDKHEESIKTPQEVISERDTKIQRLKEEQFQESQLLCYWNDQLQSLIAHR